MLNAKRQLGISKLALLLLLAVVGFFLLCAFRLIPVYLDDRYIQTALRTLDEGGESVAEMSDREIRKKIGRFFTVNNVRSQSADAIEIDRSQDSVLVIMNYEVRVPIIYNIDAVLTFNNVWDSSRPDECCKPKSE